MSLQFSPVITARKKVYTAGFYYYNLNEKFYGGLIDPILNIDHFKMSEPTFPPHPHAAFSAETYLFPHSEGSFKNRTRKGTQNKIEPGDLQWTLAGKGIMHEETPNEEGKTVEGIQLFVNLSQVNKKLPPQSIHLSTKDIPVFVPNEHVSVKVICGRQGGVESPLNLPESFTFFDVSLKVKTGFATRILMDSGALIYVYQGRLRVSGGDEITYLDQYQSVGAQTLDKDRDIRFEAPETDVKFLFLSGKSIKEPIVAHGPFVMNKAEEIEEAIKAYQRGEMGTLS